MSRGLLLLSCLVIAGCTGESDPVEGGETGAETSAVTYHEAVAPVLAERCVSCHTEGGAAPFELDDYDSARTMAKVALEKLAGEPEDKAFYEDKLVSANYYSERFLPDAGALRRKLEAGSEYMMKLPAEAFATAA